VFLRSTQHFVLGYFHGVSSGLGVFLRSTQHLLLGFFVPSLRDFGYLFKAPSTWCWAISCRPFGPWGVSSEHQHFVLG
jgi:hypothetical protein